VAYGIKRVYGIPGSSNLPLTEAIRRNPDIELVLIRHEQAASFMASAHAKLTGQNSHSRFKHLYKISPVSLILLFFITMIKSN